MKTATATLKSITPYSQGKYHESPRLEKEAPDAYEQRTWRERLHYHEDGQVFIPPMAFKNCLAEAAKYLSLKIPGKGKATFTKHFEAGVVVTEGLNLSISKQDVKSESLLVPSDGRRGGGSRVKKIFPLIPSWQGVVVFHVLDDIIDEKTFEYVLQQAGLFIGIGRFRPRNSGYYGRFNFEKIEWKGSV